MKLSKMIFIFDFLSPYSYQAWYWLRKNKDLFDQRNIKVELSPVVMAKVIKSHETKGPAEIESKRNFLFKDCIRWAKLNEVPFSLPQKLPFSSLEGLRLVYACEDGLETQMKLTDALFKIAWEKGGSLEEQSEIQSAIEEIGLGHAFLSEKASSREVRIKLKQQTQWAIDEGLFGVPVFWFKDGENSVEWFWGRDSIEQLKLFIEGNDPLDQQQYEEFLKLFK